MKYLKKRIRFILIIIFSLAILAFVQWETQTNPNLSGTKVLWITEILKIFCGGYALYGIIQFFRVK
ncbi:hypothetical protein [Companilactobacillus keshanensis]|uniref:hypothetical protein n=1 Tax=Companilactobacillus keshanensis TaxID=2486003 RepID=UPI0013DE09C9|nr:hypothetical protein [Companilactobacillus keshanensis]